MATITVYRGDAVSKAETVLNEGLRLTAYPCSANVWTIGVGIATTSGIRVRGMLNGEFYEGRPCKGLTITREEAMRVFDEHYAELEEKISLLLAHAPTPGQMGAFVDFAHQFGINAFLSSGLLKAYNFNPTNPGVLSEFVKWSRVSGKHDKGVFWRSMRRAVMYAGLAVPKWMHTPSELPFAVIGNDPGTARDDEIDYAQVPSVHQVIALVKAGDKPWTAKPAFRPPGVWADEHEANAVAAPTWPRPKPDPVRVSPEAAGRVDPTPQPLPSPPPVPSPQVSSPAAEGEGAVAVAPSPNPQVSVSPLPPVARPVPGAGRIGGGGPPVAKPRPTLETIAKDADIDLPSLRKTIAALLLWVGNLLRAVGANGIKIFGVGGSSLTVAADQLGYPFVQTAVITVGVLIVLGVVWLIGFVVEKFGLRSKKKVLSEVAA